jgi:two-component sensor histidine kinase
VLDDLANRVQSLVSVHAMLSAGGWAELKLASLVDRVAASSVQVAKGETPRGRDGTHVEVTPSPVTVTAEQAHHLGLVINELVTNTAKHGHTNGGVAIKVGIEREGEDIRLTFRDRGPGYPPDVLRGEGRSVGLNLVDAIVRLSLRGRWSLYNDGGAITEVRFPADEEPNAEESNETKA